MNTRLTFLCRNDSFFSLVGTFWRCVVKGESNVALSRCSRCYYTVVINTSARRAGELKPQDDTIEQLTVQENPCFTGKLTLVRDQTTGPARGELDKIHLISAKFRGQRACQAGTTPRRSVHKTVRRTLRVTPVSPCWQLRTTWWFFSRSEPCHHSHMPNVPIRKWPFIFMVPNFLHKNPFLYREGFIYGIYFRVTFW